MSHLTSSVACSRDITCYKSRLLCYPDSNICCHLYCCVTWLACYSPARTWLRILLFGCRMCHVASVNTLACSLCVRVCMCGMFCALHCNTVHHVCFATWCSQVTLWCMCSVLNTIFVCSVNPLFHVLPLLSVWTRSKSLSDIPMVYPVRKVPDGNTNYDVGQDAGMAQEWNQENKRRCSVAPKDSEAQWQDVSLENSYNKKRWPK